MNRVSVIGVGVMGGGMADRLLGAGFPLTVWNRSADRVRPLVERGARLVRTPRDAADGAEVVLSMVADDEASRGVWLGEDGALAAAAPDTVLIESSTLSPGWVQTLAAHAAEARCPFVEAPVTGSRLQAASGELLFLAGGADDALARARPVLETLGRGVVHLGPVGSGARMKLVNNFLCGVQAASLAEALTFIERSGLSRELALSVLAGGAPGSPLVKAVAPRMAAHDYQVTFMLALMRKDLTYAIAEGEVLGVRLDTAVAARRLFDAAVEGGFGHVDFSAVLEAVRVGAAGCGDAPRRGSTDDAGIA